MAEEQDLDTIEVALPRSLIEFVEEQVVRGGYSSASEYVCELIGAARRKLAEEEFEALVREGLESGPAIDMTHEDWTELREKARLRWSGPSEKK